MELGPLMKNEEFGRAAQLDEELMQIASENCVLVDPNLGHRPSENKTTSKRKQHKRKEVQSTDVHVLPGTSYPSLQQHNSEISGFSLELTQRLASASA